MNTIPSQRLTLRRFSSDDSQRLFELDNDPEVMRYINGGIPTPIAAITTGSLPLMLDYDDSPFGFWAAQRSADDQFIGWFSLRVPVPTDDKAELGYRLCRSAWGNGYAPEGSSALIDAAFAQTELRMITAQTYEKNLSSQRVLEKLGMERIRSFKITQDDLSHVDTSYQSTAQIWDGEDYEYALSRDRWLAGTRTG
jgi:RimJ/RimL family protein N-acetyltransferase